MSDLPRYDLHVHTRRSYDSMSSARAIVRRALRRGLAGIAITDHEAFDGVAAVRRAAPPELLVIPGMEIHTELGDLVCLFLEREVTARDAAGVIAATRAQGGLLFLPHPLRSHPVRIPDAVLDAMDGYEALNGRGGRFDPLTTSSTRSEWRRLAGKAELAGTDAHFATEVGTAYTRIAGPATAENVRARIRAADTAAGGGEVPAWHFYASQCVKLVKTRDVGMLARAGRKVLRALRR